VSRDIYALDAETDNCVARSWPQQGLPWFNAARRQAAAKNLSPSKSSFCRNELRIFRQPMISQLLEPSMQNGDRRAIDLHLIRKPSRAERLHRPDLHTNRFSKKTLADHQTVLTYSRHEKLRPHLEFIKSLIKYINRCYLKSGRNSFAVAPSLTYFTAEAAYSAMDYADIRAS